MTIWGDGVLRQKGGNLVERAQLSGQKSDQPRFDMGKQDLRVDEARDQIELRRRLAPRDAADNRRTRRPALEARAAEDGVAAQHPTGFQRMFVVLIGHIYLSIEMDF